MDSRNTKGRRDRAGDPAGTEAGTADSNAGAGTEGEGSAGGVDSGAGSSSGSGRPVGHVEVDRAAILAEAQTIAATDTAPPALEPALPPALSNDPSSKAADVAPAVRLLVAQCSSTFAPGWEITKAESDGVGDAAALVLAYWMPDGVLEPKYLALVTLATSLYAVAGSRRLADGTWMPLRAPRAPRAPASSSSTPASEPAPAGPPLRIV